MYLIRDMTNTTTQYTRLYYFTEKNDFVYVDGKRNEVKKNVDTFNWIFLSQVIIMCGGKFLGCF